MTNKKARIEQFALAAALRFIVTIRIACEWLEPRMLRRLKRIVERIKERNAT